MDRLVRLAMQFPQGHVEKERGVGTAQTDIGVRMATPPRQCGQFFNGVSAERRANQRRQASAWQAFCPHGPGFDVPATQSRTFGPTNQDPSSGSRFTCLQYQEGFLRRERRMVALVR